MADDIKYIHSNKLAKTGQQYYGKDGTVYIGQKDGRLKIRTGTNSTVTTGSTSTWGTILGDILDQEDLITYINNLPFVEEKLIDNKVFTYDVNDNIDTITITYVDASVTVQTLAYDINGNITTITATGANVYTKTFTYDVNGNITDINITY